ncbi:ABC transporter substrate-binding protein [Segnochrobactraceae bacterium EtOH-i3]
MSLNMCADQLLLALADPGQIAGLSRFARDPRLNALADAAAAYPTAPAAAEAVLMLKPDLVLTGGFTPAATRDLLAAQGIRLGEVDSVESIDAARDQIRTLAATLGHPERGDALIAQIDAALARARAEVNGAGRTALYLQRRGYVSGARTLVGDLLARLGFTSAAGAFGVGSVGAVPLERLVADPPDILILGALDRTAEDQGTVLLAHPALARSVDRAGVVEFPEILSICGGPVLPRAITTLADGLAAHPARPRK